MPRFFSNTQGTTTLITSKGTFTLTGGVALDVDDKTAAMFRESFLRGSAVKIVEAASAPPLDQLPSSDLTASTSLNAGTILVSAGLG